MPLLYLEGNLGAANANTESVRIGELQNFQETCCPKALLPGRLANVIIK